LQVISWVIDPVEYLPVTHKKMNPSSWRMGTFSRRISSSDMVPYGSSIWMSHGGSAITTANLPSTDMLKFRRSHCTHWQNMTTASKLTLLLHNHYQCCCCMRLDVTRRQPIDSSLVCSV